jgi:hypothetical protein
MREREKEHATPAKAFGPTAIALALREKEKKKKACAFFIPTCTLT